VSHVDRPLRLSELLAETARFYGERIWSALGLGAIVALAFAIAGITPALVGIVVVCLAFTTAYAAAARMVSGDRFGEAWAQVGVRLPVLLVLALIVALPFAVAVGYLILIIVAVAWLALTGFAIPVAMLERDPTADTLLGRLGFALRRTIALARLEFWHAAGVAAALVIAYAVIGILLAQLLVGFAENSSYIAVVLVQLVLAPFFFFGLSLLYYDQRARDRP
jgi:hypothetical protein